MLRTTIVCLLLTACADRVEPPDPARVCTDAADILAACGFATDQSPFGTCAAEQREHAEDLIAIYSDGGCAAITDAKADGFACSALPFLCVEHSAGELAPFVTDGCSMFPDGTLANPTRWQHCCIEHDFAYYTGGPSALREAADSQLYECILAETNKVVADLVYYGVRIGGTPVLATPWRWGYGWVYDPLDGYRSLPSAQAAAAANQIAAYKAHPVPPMALEQRLLFLANFITLVPRLAVTIAEVTAALHSLE